MNRCWNEEAGGALATVLVMLTVMSLVVGTVMAVFVVHSRFVQRDAHRLQARYTAESGIERALVRLETEIGWRADQQLFDLRGTGAGRLTVEPFGAFIRVLSTGQAGGEDVTIRALVGDLPPFEFERAIFLGDAMSDLILAGRTRISGDIVVGEMGVREALFDGRPFSGHRVGSVESVAAPQLPEFDDFLLRETLTIFNKYLSTRTTLPQSSEGLRVVFSDGDLHFATTDSALFDAAVLMVTPGNLVLTGRLVVRPGSRFVAGGMLHVTGQVSGHETIFYGRRGVVVADDVRCSGQFFSDENVHVTGGAYLTYPSLLYVSPSAVSSVQTLRIEVSGTAAVDGTVIYRGGGGPSRSDRSSITIGQRAIVRGGVYSTARTELSGNVLGSIVTYQFHFYESPSDYVNWLKDAVIDVRARPPRFLLPPGFSARPRLQIVTLETEARV